MNYQMLIMLCMSGVSIAYAHQDIKHPITRAEPIMPLQHQWVQAFQSIKAERIDQVLKDAQNNYGSDKDAFLKFLLTRDDKGRTGLIYASIAADIEAVRLILDTAQAVFGDETDYYFHLFNARDMNGRSAFLLGTETMQRALINYLIKEIARLVGADKQHYFKLINIAGKIHGKTPLMNMLTNFSVNNVSALLAQAEKIFGPESLELQRLVNTRDRDGYTPLSYASTPRERFLLTKHGARVDKRRPISALSHELLHAVKDNNFDKVKIIMPKAAQHYKGNNRAYFDFIVAADNGGWNALMNAVADGHYDMVDYIINQIEDFFGDDAYSILRIFNRSDVEGRAILPLALTRRHYELADLILSKAQELSNDPLFFIQFITNPDEANGFTPLIAAVYNTSAADDNYRIINHLVQLGATIFGRQTKIFDKFINARDFDNHTALAYANDPKVKALLRNYGAHE